MTRDPKPPRPADPAALVLGYLNFSAGAFDPAVWRAFSDLFAAVESAGERPETVSLVAAELRSRLAALEATEPAFRDSTQARETLRCLFDDVLPGYRRFHGDLLEHQPSGAIERPFFVMAAAQALLAAGGPAGPGAIDEAIVRLNDYVGWRPVAVLENGRLSEPYPHERVRPVPLWIAGAGAAHGRYRDLATRAIEILGAAPEGLVRQADFDLEALEEFAIDPRAFDFLHPAASRPNYLFGLWDPSRIDERGRYRRMVVQQATLDGILSWPEAAAGSGPEPDPRKASQLRLESAAVLAGVMLMASGLSGHGPGAHQAAAPLAELLPRIAGYRDEFYRWMLTRLDPDHRQRLEDEISRLRQPFGGVRRHINSLLASRRARQVEAVALAGVFSRLGRAAGAERMAALVPAASARMFARITSRVVAAQTAVRRGGDGGTLGAGAAVALDELDAATELLYRAVGCGAAVDPWNILGLSGQFPLHEPGGESLPDPRVDDLVSTVASILDGYAAAWRAASVEGPPALAARAGAACEKLAAWWDRHATTAVSGVPHLSGREMLVSSREVIGALGRRRETAPSPPPPGFWRNEVAEFSSPRSHSHAAEALLREGDLDGAMGLLVHWASLLEGVEVERLGAVWLASAAKWLALAVVDRTPAGRNRVRRFLELVEANTSGASECIERFAQRPDSSPRRRRSRGDDDVAGEDADDDSPGSEESVAAAYESMVWHDSTDDGIDDGMLDVEGAGGAAVGGVGEVEHAAEFLGSLFRLLRQAVTTLSAADVADGSTPTDAEIDSLKGWRHHLRRLRRTMVRAAGVIAGADPVPPTGMPPSEYDRLRWQRDAAAERLVDAAVQATETLWMLSARLHVGRPPRKPPAATKAAGRAASRGAVGRLLAALQSGDAEGARQWLEVVRGRLVGQPVLYVPLSRGGRPDRIVRARARERLLERLAGCLPRVGLVAETSAIVHLAKALESRRPQGAASVSEFDRVFEAATSALVERIVVSARSDGGDTTAGGIVTERILEGLSLLVPRLLDTWMTHARQLRLSVLERVRDPRAFAALREFIERYGSGLFTQHLLAPPSLRGILRGGVRRWLDDQVERHGNEPADAGGPIRPRRLIDGVSSGELPTKQAASRMRLALECIAENHAEYRDWNSTTTQSDRGECLHILLEFLLIKAEYERIAWTLRPVNMAHRVLARTGVPAAAEAWRGRMREETADTAAEITDKLAKLEAQWGVRLACIADRVRRPFTAVLEQDDLEALVEPAVGELVCGAPAGAGARFEERAAGFIGVAGGSGVEIPDWLDRLGTTVDRELDSVGTDGRSQRALVSLPDAVPWLPLGWADLRAALEPRPAS
jgi:hypothetical protein